MLLSIISCSEEINISQVNPHINLFFFSSRGTVGRPVTHRRGRGWRGGFIGTAFETALKLDLQKYLKILRHLELLPRPLGQDWSEIWLQRFSGTITIWPKSQLSDFWNILSDPSAARLGRMIRAGEHSAWPKIRFIENRMKVEKVIIEGLRSSQQKLGEPPEQQPNTFTQEMQREEALIEPDSSYLINGSSSAGQRKPRGKHPLVIAAEQGHRRPSSILQEIKRQSSVFFDDTDDGIPSHSDAAFSDEEGASSAVTDDEGEAEAFARKEKGHA